jgi:hypothetical protein
MMGLMARFGGEPILSNMLWFEKRGMKKELKSDKRQRTFHTFHLLDPYSKCFPPQPRLHFHQSLGLASERRL